MVAKRREADEREARVALGLCAYYRCDKPAAPGRRLCEVHHAYHRERGEAYRANCHAAGLCI
jgi:hypothetical protein